MRLHQKEYVMVTEKDGKRVSIPVPLKVSGATGVVSLSALGNEVTATGPNNTTLGTYVLTRKEAGGSIKFTGADGHASNTVFSASKASNGDVTISGTYNGSAFSSVYSPTGEPIKQQKPDGVNPVELNIAAAVLHIDLPPKPSPFIPKDTKTPTNRERAATGTTTSPVAGPQNVHCTLAIIATVLAVPGAATGLGALALSFAIHVAAFECLF
jgi:hypothetical protein